MKKILLSLLGCVLSVQCFASSMNEQDGKIYLSPGSVYVSADSIYVNVDGIFVQVESIASDANGIYIQDSECRLRDPNRRPGYYCLRCERYHQAGERCSK